ncbi:MAG: VWA domain-containing protein [Minisyncoccia bacterium]
MEEIKLPALSREELNKLLVTDADAFTQLRYLRHREGVPVLGELESAGEKQIPGFAGCLADIYHSLWARQPSIKEEVAPARRYWQNILRAALASSSYEQAQAQTQLSELRSVIGSIQMGESIARMVPKEDKEKLQTAQQAQSAADDAEAEATQAEAEVEAAEGLATEPQGGSGGEALAQMLAEAQVKAANARAQADAAQAQAEAVAEALLGKPNSVEAAQKLEELARIGLAAAKNAQAKVEEVSETLEAWGLEEGELVREGMPEAMGILERIKNSADLKKFAKLLGRIRRIAARKAKSDDRAEGVRVSTLETGREIKRAVPRELAALATPGTRPQVLLRWARGELTLRGEKEKKKLGEGPVVVCEDSSGSMDGSKRQWAKAVTLALAHYAKLRGRSFAWIMFDSRVQVARVYPKGRLTAKDLLEIAESRSGGGTNFEEPLRKALEVIRSGGLKKADIAFITDGECEVSAEFLVEFAAEKKRVGINVCTVLCDVGTTSGSAVEKFSDHIEKASSFNDADAEKVIGNMGGSR